MLEATKNKRVIAHKVAKRFGEIIIGMPAIRPRHLKAIVRKDMVCSLLVRCSRMQKPWY